jgi:PAS domain S-box-containing protein
VSHGRTPNDSTELVSGAPLVGGRWFFRLILFLALATLVFAPLAFIFPGPRPIDRFVQTLVTAVGFFAAAAFAWRDRRPLAVVTGALTLLGGSILSAYLAPPYAAEAVGITVIAAVLILPATSRRAMLPVLIAVGLAGIAAVAVSRVNYVAATTNVTGAVISAASVIFVALAFVGWIHIRLVTALERARMARATLDESEERYRTLVETAPDGIVVINSTTMRMLQANQRAAELFGFPDAAALLDADPQTLFPGTQPGGRNTATAARALVAAALEGRTVVHELVYLHANGTPFTAEIRMTLAAIAGRTDVRISLTDVSDRVAALRARDLTEARFRSLFTSSPNAILVVDPDGRIVDASDRASDIFGCSADVLRSMTVEDLIPGAQRSAHVAQRAAFNREPADRAVGAHPALMALRVDGTAFPAEIGLSWFDTDEGRFATVVVADVTARRQSEHAAREATETIRAIFDASPAGISVTALDGTVRLWNRAMTSLTGISDSEAVGRVDPSVPAERAEGRALIRDAVARNETVTAADLFLARPDGSTVQAVGSFGPLHDASGQVVGIVGVVEDVTAMRGLEAQVNRKARLESVGQLAGGIAHDINNVLTAIGGFASLSLDDLDAGLPVDREAIATIAEGAARTGALTRQLLAFARRDVRPAETIAFGETVLAVEPMLRGLIGEHIGLTVSTTDVGHVRIAGSQVEQLVLNLVVNSRDALANGGSIRVQVANVDVTEHTIGSYPGVAIGPWIGLTVSDDGTGMAPDVAERVFDPFFTTKGPDEGTGLGLSTVHGIVTGAGGHISVTSEVGVGTTFRILLPQTEDVPTEVPVVLAAVERGHETILLVEDEALVRSLATRVLKRAGFRIIAAANATEALTRAAEHGGPIDLLVTDVIMPRILGPDLAIRLARVRPGLRVLFTSGYTAGGTGLTAMLPPDARFIDKPFSPGDLVAAVRAALDDTSLPLAG